MTLNYCPKCGAEVDSDTTFCSTCGADIRELTVKEPSKPPKTLITTPQPQTTDDKSGSAVADQKTSQGNNYGDFWERFVALIIDVAILGIINVLFYFILDWYIAILLSYLIALLYFWLLETYNKGQTVGKIAMKLRTVNEDTLEVASIGDYLLNNLLKSLLIGLIIDFILGLIVNSGDPKNKFRIMENASKTVVIQTK